MKLFHTSITSNNRVHLFFMGKKILSYKTNRLVTQVFIVDNNGNQKLIKNKKQLPRHVIVDGGNATNLVKIHHGIHSNRLRISFAEDAFNCTCEIGDSCKKSSLDANIRFFPGNGTSVHIGNNVVMNGTDIAVGNGSKLQIGNNCMFSYAIIIRTTDGHTIVEKDTNKVLNNQRVPCIIGNNCWIGLRTVINKNAQIPDDTIVGNCSVLTGQFTEPFTVIGGAPARVLKQNVQHNRDSIYHFTEKHPQ